MLTSYVEEIIGCHRSTNDDVLCLSDTAEKMRVQWGSTSVIYRLKWNLDSGENYCITHS